MSEADLGVLLAERRWRSYCPDWDSSSPEELAEAFALFCRECWKIEVPGKGFELFELRWYQREAVQCWLDNRFSIVLKARQIGFTTLAAAFVFWVAFFYESRSVVVLSATERDAIILLQKSKYGFKRMPDWVKDRGPLQTNKHQKEMRFSNDSRIESLPSQSDPARGRSPFLVVVDEMGMFENAEDTYAAVKPTVDIGGSLICMGTAKGVGNLFYTLWECSQNGTNQFTSVFYPWHVVPHRDQDWYDAEARGAPGDWYMAQEYPDNSDEAWLRSGRPVFDLAVLRDIEPVPPKRGYLTEERGALEFVEDGGPLRVWREPQPKHVYVVGGDVAQGLVHGDFSSVHVIDARTHEVVAHWHGHVDPDQLGSDVLDKLGRWYNKALQGVEVNNHGLTTIKFLQQAKYPNIYRQRRLQQRKQEPSELMGFRTTEASKAIIIDQLHRELRDGAMRLSCADTIAELRSYVRDDRGRTNGSPHDDRVISLALAVEMLKHVWLAEYKIEDEQPGPGTMGFLVDKLFKPERDEPTPIGAFSVRRSA